MKRRIISMLLAICLVCSMLPFTALAAQQRASGAFGDGLSWTLDSEGTLTITGSGPVEEAPWQDCLDEIRNVVIADGITSIPEEAFDHCLNMESVSIPDSVTEIGKYAFYFCTNLTSVRLPADLTVLDEGVFSWCLRLTEVEFPENLTSIGDYAFHYCRSLSDVAIPDSVTAIGDHAFFETRLAQVDLPESLVSIGDYCFGLCDLRHVRIPAGVREIGNYAFEYGNRTTIVFEGNAPAIAENAFYDARPVVFYPAGDETWTADVMLDYGGNDTVWTDLSIASITVENERFYENTNGDMDTDSDPDTGEESSPYFRYEYYPEVTVTLSDGRVFRDYDDMVNIDGVRIPVVYIDDQSVATPWGVGDHTVTAVFAQTQTSFTVTVMESPITGFVVEPVVLIENVDGSLDGHWDENDEWHEDTWFNYDYSPRMVTVFYKDGTSETIDANNIVDTFGTWLNCTSLQCYDNQWGVGTHTASAWFLGYSCEYQVTIVENPVERIEVESITMVEGVDGYRDGHHDEATGDWIDNSWFFYEPYPKQITVYYKDGTSLTGDTDEIYEQTGRYVEWETDQSYYNQWDVGTHTATATFMGISCDYQVTIEQSPVERIEVEPMTLIENSSGNLDSYWDEEQGIWVEDAWFCYNTYPRQMTVYFRDGSVLTGSPYDMEEQTGYWVYHYDDQDYTAPWGVGTHTATVEFMGCTCDYQVTVQESPVARIEIDPITRMEYADGYWDGYWDEEQDIWVDEAWYCYHIWPETMTVYYKDGTVLTGYCYDIEEQTGYYVQYDSDQSYEAPWGVGTHTATAEFMGATCTYQVTIVENPVERIEVKPITLIEGTGGFLMDDWDEELQEEVKHAYYHYSTAPREMTVYYKDGTALTGTAGQIYKQTGYEVWYNDPQYDEGPWGLGTYTVTAGYLGYTADYQITIVESPVERIEVAPLTLTEGVDGHLGGHWDGEDWVENSWFYYEIVPAEMTVYYKDGTSLTGSYEEICVRTGYGPQCDSDQSYEDPWGVGTYTAYAWFMGQSCEYQVTIVPDPDSDSTVTYTSASISLAGDIGVNYYVQLSDDIVADPGAFMEFTVAGNTQRVPLTSAEAATDANGVTTYRFTCKVAAKQMTEQITGRMYKSNGPVGEAKVYSVKAYCDAAIPVYSQYAAYADLVELMEAMLNYGGYSQVQFGYDTDNLANAGMDTTLPAITAADVDAYAHGATGSEEGISVASVSLLLESTTTIRFYFKLDGTKSIDEYTFYVDGVETTPVEANGQYYVDKVNVAAKDLDEMVTVTVGGLTAKYCGLSYVRQVAVLYPSYYSEALINVARALYAYNQAANAYFA